MRHRPVIFLAVGLSIGLLPPAAVAAASSAQSEGSSNSHIITVYDSADAPCDMEPAFCWVDIRVATMRSYVGGTGRRMVAVTIVGYEPHPQTNDSSLKVRFDTTGGPEPDWYVKMGLAAYGNGPAWWCSRYTWTKRYHIEVSGERMTCFIPERDLNPTKPIRFQAFAKLIGGVVDRAPDQGWAG